jgi:hypothetical protein
MHSKQRSKDRCEILFGFRRFQRSLKAIQGDVQELLDHLMLTIPLRLVVACVISYSFDRKSPAGRRRMSHSRKASCIYLPKQ